jgi:Ser-tRNA(Ala) deacylase AlaX
LYTRELQTRVKAHQPTEGGVLVEFEDSILFPEGGGQPSDAGTVPPP